MADFGSSGETQVAAYMPPHPPANMLDHFMTQYDYDYNREAAGAADADGVAGGAETDAWMSGEVRNRPPFAMGGEWDGNTTYRVDYVPMDRRLKDLRRLVQAVGTDADASAFTREWYRPDLTRAGADGHPISVYKADYTLSGRVPKGKSTLYAGAPSVPYRPELLTAHDVLEDDGADIAPKITSREALLPRLAAADAHVPAAGAPPKSQGPAASARPPPLPHAPTEYSCTSWTYGDTSPARPDQLPQGLEGSARADLLGTMEDKAALLRLLAGKQPHARKEPFPIEDATNPVFLSRAQQKTCAVSKRVDDEGHVKMTMYMSDFIDQARLPELPGNHPDSDVRDTNQSATATVGEMAAGTMTKLTRISGSLRNSHGTLKKEAPASLCGTVPPAMLATMRAQERASATDRADPHRHKLH